MSDHHDDHVDEPSVWRGDAPTDADGGTDERRIAYGDEERLYTPGPDERQLTVRAVVTGCLIGAVVGAMNISLGLKIGWSFGASIIAAILGYAVWHILRPKREFGVMETNIAQTAGSATGAMASTAGLLAPIPALALFDEPIVLSYWQLLLWALAVGFLGVFYAVPLRRQMVVVEKLRFPTGTATAETIMSVFAEGKEAVRKARTLLIFAVLAAGWTLVMWLVNFAIGRGAIDRPPNLAVATLGSLGAFLTTWGFFKLNIGPRIGISLLLGALVGYLILGYGVLSNHTVAAVGAEDAWINGPLTTWREVASSSNGVRSWILWPGVAIMVADALTSLGLSWRSIINTFRPGSADANAELEDPSEQVPNLWWLGGLTLGGALAILISSQVFGIPWWMTLLAVIMSSLLAAIAVRCVGETDINPVGGMGKVTQLVYGGITESTTTNLMSAAVTGAGASQAADMMQDLKTGRMLGASPRKQILAQCIGICAGIPIVCGVYKLFEKTQDIGGPDSAYGAPAAHAWKAVAEVMSGGFENLPNGAPSAILIALIVGIALPILRKVSPASIANWIPSGLAFGIAFIVYPYDSVTMFAGSMALVLWRVISPKTCAALVFAVASGLLVGEGLMNVLTAAADLVIEAAGL